VYDGILPWLLVAFGFRWLDAAVRGLGLGGVATGLAFLAAVGLVSSLWALPADLFATFAVEARHGFNRQTPAGFAVDRLKGLAVSAVVGLPLGAAILWLMRSAGDLWWVLAFAAFAAVQVVVSWLYPLAILPLFNRLEPVEGDLAGAISDLASRVGFPLESVVSMDGSRRSSHSNAFIAGLFGARKIVLWDTLVESLGRAELIAVVAHELGHFRLGHVRRRAALVICACGALFALLGWFEGAAGASSGMGFDAPSDHASLAAFGLLAAEGLFPLGWLSRVASRRGELAADRFAVDATATGADLARALESMFRENLTSPGSHRLYRSYRNTHPSLRERLRAIGAHARSRGLPTGSDGGEVDCAVPPEGDRGVGGGRGRGEGDADLGRGEP